MRKRTGIITISLLAAALAVAAFFIRKDKQVIVVDPWVAVPSDAFLIIETPDFPELLTRVTDPSGLPARLSGMKWASTLVKRAAMVDSVTGGRELREAISNRTLLLSFHATTHNTVMPLAVMSAGTYFTPRRMEHLCKVSGATLSTAREAGGARIYTISYGHGSSSDIYLALTSGIVLASPSEALITAALVSKGSSADIRHQQGVNPVVKASGKDADNIFILFRNLPGFMRSFVSPDRITSLTSVAVAAGGDLTVSEEGLFLSGFLSTAGAGTAADRLLEVEPAECGVQELLPTGTLSYTTIMRRASLRGETASDPASINASDLALILSPFTGNEVTDAIVPAGDSREKVRIFRMTDTQSAEQVLKKRLTEKYYAMGLVESHFLASSGFSGEEERVMYKMPFSGVASILSGNGDNRADDGWVVFVRSYMVFSDSPEALTKIRVESDRERTLINDPDFRQMEKTLPTKSSYIFYSTGEELRSLISGVLTREAEEKTEESSLAGIGGIGLSLTPSNDMIYASLSVRYSDAGEQHRQSATFEATGESSNTPGLNLLWRVKLDAAPAMSPFLFVNHNTGATEIFIQDQQNNIYLISASGKILWKAPIREKITGEVQMIDYYKNNKNQLLFSGKNYMYLVDRNGHYVDKYPVKMRSPATNSLAVFDYEKNKDYRLFIAGEDRKVYVYDRSGAPVRGWNIFTTRGQVKDPVAFFRVRGKDYLVVADDQDVYVLDRTGNIRVAHQEPLKKAANSAIRLTGEENQAIIFSTPEGEIVRLFFDGTFRKQELTTLTATHSADFSDLNGDGLTDYIIVDNGMLHAYNSDGSEIYSHTFESGAVKGPELFSVGSSEEWISAYEDGSEMIYLFGKTGNIIPGFPLKGGQYYTVGRVTNKSTWNFLNNENDFYVYNYELTSVSR
jgi:hypothetical protein